MGLRKCPRCELNYIRDDQKYCNVCQRAALKSEPEPDEEATLMCSECGENPAVKGSDLCPICLRERRMQEKFAESKAELDPGELHIDALDELEDVPLDDAAIPESELEEIDKELSEGDDLYDEDEEDEEEGKDDYID